MKRFVLCSFLIVVTTSAFAQEALKLHFKQGDFYHLKLNEVLFLSESTSQVDSENAEPSWRMTEYNFTETIDSVYPDGSASIGATLDSFSTRIMVKETTERNEFFRFNSNNEGDIRNRLRDIRALPRAQFLGQTLRYTVGTDGLIKNFQNLSNFQAATYARSFDYDMLHAMISMTDSLRIGQLLEQGFGAIAAFSNGSNGKLQTPYTFAEIHVTRNMTASKNGDAITFTNEFTNIPDTIDYLEGIAFPMNVQHFKGLSKGTVKIKDGMTVSGSAVDSAKLDLVIPGDMIKTIISRRLSFEREPLKVQHGGTVKFKELESHREVYPKDPTFDEDPNIKMITIDPKIFTKTDTTKRK